MTPFLLPGGATDVSSQARRGTGGRCAKAGSEAALGEGEPQNRGCPAHSQQAAGQSPAPLRGAGNRRIHSLPATGWAGLSTQRRWGRHQSEAGDWTC